MTAHRLATRRGVALPMAIFALVVIGILVGASFYIGRQEQTVGRNTVRLQQAFSAAEGGMQLQVANWDPSVYNQLAIGGAYDIWPRTVLSRGRENLQVAENFRRVPFALVAPSTAQSDEGNNQHSERTDAPPAPKQTDFVHAVSPSLRCLRSFSILTRNSSSRR